MLLTKGFSDHTLGNLLALAHLSPTYHNGIKSSLSSGWYWPVVCSYKSCNIGIKMYTKIVL